MPQTVQEQAQVNPNVYALQLFFYEVYYISMKGFLEE